MRPPSSAPLPGPALVTKNVMLACCATASPVWHRHKSAAASGTNIRFATLILSSFVRDRYGRVALVYRPLSY
jgi:hypothetical protein